MTLDDALAALPPELASALRLGGAETSGLVAALRRDSTGAAVVELAVPLGPGGAVDSPGAARRALAGLRGADVVARLTVAIPAPAGLPGDLVAERDRAAAFHVAVQCLGVPLAEPPRWLWLPPSARGGRRPGSDVRRDGEGAP